jgi:hypothetical protein
MPYMPIHIYCTPVGSQPCLGKPYYDRSQSACCELELHLVYSDSRPIPIRPSFLNLSLTLCSKPFVFATLTILSIQSSFGSSSQFADLGLFCLVSTFPPGAAKAEPSGQISQRLAGLSKSKTKAFSPNPQNLSVSRSPLYTYSPFLNAPILYPHSVSAYAL